MKKQRSARYLIKSEINIVPLLDVLLVLLVIFMMIPSRLIQNFEVNLPDSEITSNFIDNDKSLITIEILGTGFYNLIINNKKIERVHLEHLILEISTINTTTNIKCLIAASKTVVYNEVIQILNVLSKIGINSIGIITNPI